jgi:hypothetical protein
MLKSDNYLKKLRQRGKDSHVYRKYQLLGLEIAQILGDEKHKALYIKLAKERKNVKNKGAYFMRVITDEKKE